MTQWNLFTRVIVTFNPTDSSTILIVLDEPHVQEYVLDNKTEKPLIFQKYD